MVSRQNQDFLDRRDLLFASVAIESLDRDHVETNRDPQAYFLLFIPRAKQEFFSSSIGH